MSGLHIQHKRNFHAIRWFVAIIVLIALSVYAYFGVRWYNTGELSPLPLPVAAADTSVDESVVSDALLQKHTAAANAPRYLEIPKLGVAQARVSKAGVTSRNMLDTPHHIDDASWYVKSAEPGSGVGAVLLNGHSSGRTRPGAFAKAASLVKGDQISVERGDGKIFTYEVYDVRDMPLDWVNKVGMKEMMYSALPQKEGLSLLTDAGKWIPKEKVFDRRVLVRATIIE
jgi:hypothetical protein